MFTSILFFAKFQLQTTESAMFVLPLKDLIHQSGLIVQVLGKLTRSY